MKNKYEIRGDITTIFIESPTYGLVETIIETADLERANEMTAKWYVDLSDDTGSFYVIGSKHTNGKRSKPRLHRWLLEAKNGMVVDHINHDTLDNRRSNLREVTNSQNCQNLLGPQVNNTSGYRGVTWHKRNQKWQAQLMVNSKRKYLGYFDSIEEANKAAVEGRKKYMTHSAN